MKSQLRKEILGKRDRLTPEEIAIKSQAIVGTLLASPAYLESRRIFCFLSFGSEVDTRAIIRDAWERNKLVYVPRINRATDEMQPVLYTRETPLLKNRMGIEEPAGLSEDLAASCASGTDSLMPETFDLVVVPCVAYDYEGYRIGYGRGYYDRFFAKTKTTHKIGVAFSVQIVPRLPRENHDIPVDQVLTEDGYLRLL